MSFPSPGLRYATATLSPEGRGDASSSAGVDGEFNVAGGTLPSPLWGEGGLAQPSRVRGRKVTPVGVSKARSLRRRTTDAEQLLWGMLRGRRFQGLKFLRQFPVEPFVVDFVCRELMLVVELDGSQHADDEQTEYDERRTAYLNARGYSVLRFWNDETRDLDGVWQLLSAIVDGVDIGPSPGWRYSPAALSPEGRGKNDTSRT